jgi:hypothetical protein
VAKKNIKEACISGMAANWIVMAAKKEIMDVKIIPFWFLDKRICKALPTARNGGP